MKKIAIALVLGMSMMACKASVKVAAKTPEAPPPAPVAAAPAPEPAPKQGEAINLPEQIEFELDEARLKQTQRTLGTLEALADVMKKHPEISKLRIEGHTDATGKAKHNDKLSKARAEAVATWLVEHDVDASRLSTVGYGASHPLVANDTAEHRAQNRRTEYYVAELGGKPVNGAAPATTTASADPIANASRKL